MFDNALLKDAEELLALCRAAGLRLATAESCTGGLIAACLTEIPGSSDVVERGFVTYSDAAKTEMLGVPAEMIHNHGAVSEEVVRAMCAGALARAPADLAVAVTGIAGPGGARPGKPVGLVHLATCRRDGEIAHMLATFSGDRTAIRHAAVVAALALLSRQI